MVAREQGSLTELLHGDLRRGHVGIAEAEIDDVVARTPKLELQPLDLREGESGLGNTGLDVVRTAAPLELRYGSAAATLEAFEIGTWEIDLA